MAYTTLRCKIVRLFAMHAVESQEEGVPASREDDPDKGTTVKTVVVQSATLVKKAMGDGAAKLSCLPRWYRSS